jgi:hypothetical protein
VTALLKAAELPTTPTDVGDCVIVPLDQPQSTPKRELDPASEPALGTTGVLVLEPEVRFTALHALTTTVPGNLDDDGARELAQSRFGRVVGLLALAQGPHHPPPLVQVVSVAPVPVGHRFGDPLTLDSKPVVLGNHYDLIVNPMSNAAASRFLALNRMAKEEVHVATLIKLWQVAENANRKRFSEADFDACLVHYCNVIEQVAITVQPKTPQVSEADFGPVVANLLVRLQGEASAPRKVKAIEVSAQKIRELKFQGSRRRLIRALDLLGIAGDFHDRVVRVWDARSSFSGHPSPISASEQQVDDARLAGGDLLMHYFNWRWNAPQVKL